MKKNLDSNDNSSRADSIVSITFKLKTKDKGKIKLIANLKGITIPELIMELIDKEFSSMMLKAKIRNQLPYILRKEILKELTIEAIPIYEKYKDELYVDETGDGIN